MLASAKKNQIIANPYIIIQTKDFIFRSWVRLLVYTFALPFFFTHSLACFLSYDINNVCIYLNWLLAMSQQLITTSMYVPYVCAQFCLIFEIYRCSICIEIKMPFKYKSSAAKFPIWCRDWNWRFLFVLVSSQFSIFHFDFFAYSIHINQEENWKQRALKFVEWLI